MKGEYEYTQTVVLSNDSEIEVQHKYSGAVPMDLDRREEIYKRQRDFRAMTIRQERQLRHAYSRAIMRSRRAD